MSVVRKITLMVVTGLLCAITVAGILAWHSGYRLYIVHTGSMAPAVMAGDVVLDGPATGTYHPGEIITFRHSAWTTDIVTHRVTDLRGGVIHTKGDANRTADVWDIRPNQVQGVYVMRLPRLGYLMVFLRQPTGIAAVVAGGLALMLLWGLLNPKSGKEEQARSARRRASSTPPTGGAAEPGGRPRAAGPLPDGTTRQSPLGFDATAGPTANPEPDAPARAEASNPAT
jgi:signal peptidase